MSSAKTGQSERFKESFFAMMTLDSYVCISKIANVSVNTGKLANAYSNISAP